MKIVYIYELFFEPFDEGVKNFALMIQKNLAEDNDVRIIRNIRTLPNAINSLLLVPRILLCLLAYRPERVIFIPQASLTFSSFVKIFLLGLFAKNRLTIVGTQKRVLSEKQKQIVRRFNIEKLFVLSTAMAEPLKDLDINCQIINAGIDRDRYHPTTAKPLLREKYRIPVDKFVLLHVGHIKEKRNIRWLQEIQQNVPDIQTVLIGSTTTVQDKALCAEIEASGVIVIREYLSDIQELYQLSDIYCFTVTREDGAMETPLSVLEAMAVDLPIITTPFGRLPELFKEDKFYRYANSAAEIISLLNSGFGRYDGAESGINREKTKSYTWRSAASRLLAH